MDLTLELVPCSDEILAVRRAFNKNLETSTSNQLQWHQCESPQAYRDKRRNGTDGFPKPILDKGAAVFAIPSTHGSHNIQLRRIAPVNGPKGVLLHFHGGGLVYGSADGQDHYLAELAHELSLAVVSVEYRLAPEHEFPAAGEDALDAIRFALSKDGCTNLGGKLRFIVGDSSGAYLVAWSILRLRDEGVDVKKEIESLVLNFGIYDLSFTPSIDNYKGRALLNGDDVKLLVEAAFPSTSFSLQRRKSPQWSPLYADLRNLPPALFVVGTADPMMDDSVFMASRWSLEGNSSTLKIFPEACHAFILLPVGDAGAEGRREIKAFLRKALA